MLDADTFIDGCGVVPDIPLGRGVRIRFGQGAASLSVTALGEGAPSSEGGSGEGAPCGDGGPGEGGPAGTGGPGDRGGLGEGGPGEGGVRVAGHYGALTMTPLATNAVQVHARPPSVD